MLPIAVSPFQQAVQEELVRLKQVYHHQLHLKKALAGSATFPFPLVISFITEPPEAAEPYDIGALKVSTAAHCSKRTGLVQTC